MSISLADCIFIPFGILNFFFLVTLKTEHRLTRCMGEGEGEAGSMRWEGTYTLIHYCFLGC